MRKSPLSAPGGSYGRKNTYDWNSRDRQQQQQQQQHGYEDRPGSGGYGNNFHGDNNKHGSFSPANSQTSSPQASGDDFIPLGYSSPVNHRPRYNNSPNWRGHGNGYRHRGTPPSAGGAGGFNNSYRHNFYHDSAKSNFNDSNSPKFYKKQHFAQRRPHQKDAHRHIDISNYLNVKSILEDPWAELMRNLEKRNTGNGNKVETPGRTSASESSCGSILIEDLTVKSNSSNLDPVSPDTQITVNDQKSEITSTTTTTS